MGHEGRSWEAASTLHQEWAHHSWRETLEEEEEEEEKVGEVGDGVESEG